MSSSKDTDYLVFSPNTSFLNTPGYPAQEVRFLESVRVDLSQVQLIPVLKLSLSVSLFFTITDYPSFIKKIISVWKVSLLGLGLKERLACYVTGVVLESQSTGMMVMLAS